MDLKRKKEILLKPCIRVSDVMYLTGYKKSKAYSIMNVCRTRYNGQAGIRTDAITTKSLCLALGTTIEDELYRIHILEDGKEIQDRNVL